MRKIITVNLILILLTTLFMFPVTYEAETLGDLKRQLAESERKERANQDKEEKTQEEIATLTREIGDSQKQIEDGQNKIEESKKEIEKLNDDIKEKEKETQELIRFLQISNGENAYLEYIFGATSMSDLINRMAIVEQISNYNNEVIEEMNGLIKKNQQLQKDLAAQEKELEKKIKNFEMKIDDLGDDLITITDTFFKLSDQIKEKKETIQIYEKMGCKDDQEIFECTNFPVDSSFIKPISTGIVTSNYGWRTFYLNGRLVTDYHYAIDIGTGREGYNVYPAAAGLVSAVYKKTSCGGNTVYVDHIINGVNYSTVYMHLQSIKVKPGDPVLKSTVIGKSGGGPSTYAWDTCTGGAHLHFGIAKGHYESYNSWIARSIDPKKKIHFESGWFNSR